MSGGRWPSQGILDRFPDENGRLRRGSSSEKVFADINGVRQGMFIQSTCARTYWQERTISLTVPDAEQAGCW
jgi:hypothetical protein